MRRSQMRHEGELTWDSQAVNWPAPFEAGPPGGDSNLWMCADDAGLEIWSHFHRLERRVGRWNSQPLALERCSDELRSLLVAALPYAHYRDDLSGAVAECARMIAQTVVLRGRMVFEIEIGWRGTGEQRHLRAARLTYVPAHSIMRTLGGTYQVVPPHATRSAPEGQVVRLNSRRLVEFTVPRKWRRTLASVRSGLPRVGRTQRNWATDLPREHEDAKEIIRKHKEAIARLTAPIGWNGRGLMREHVSDSHWALRELRWKRFCIELRDAIFSTLEDAFRRIGKLRDEMPKLTCNGLPTSDDVNRGVASLMGDGGRIDQMLAPFRLTSAPDAESQ